MTKQELQVRIGQNMFRLRTDRKMTQDYVAEKVGISTTHYANLECGNKSTTILTLCKIAEVLGASMDAVIQEDHKDSRITVIANLLRDQPEENIEFVEKLVRLCISELPNHESGTGAQSDQSLEVNSC